MSLSWNHKQIEFCIFTKILMSIPWAFSFCVGMLNHLANMKTNDWLKTFSQELMEKNLFKMTFKQFLTISKRHSNDCLKFFWKSQRTQFIVNFAPYSLKFIDKLLLNSAKSRNKWKKKSVHCANHHTRIKKLNQINWSSLFDSFCFQIEFFNCLK